MAPATSRHALIVAHGSPAEPAAQDMAIRALAARVGAVLPRWEIRGATLAAPGALERAMAELDQPVIYPFFMAPGWFVDTCLPARLGAGAGGRMAPMGTDPDLPRLVAAQARATLAAHQMDLTGTTVVIAAHGNPKHPESGQAALRFAAALEALLQPGAVQPGFIEEPPFLEDAARVRAPALCVPFFATDAGHVIHDIPRALSAANFSGPVLPPLIRYPGIDALIAGALGRSCPQRRAA